MGLFRPQFENFERVCLNKNREQPNTACSGPLGEHQGQAGGVRAGKMALFKLMAGPVSWVGSHHPPTANASRWAGTTNQTNSRINAEVVR